jgi:hypothetical protein
MNNAESTIRKIHTVEEAASLCGLDDVKIYDWFILQAGLLGIIFPGNYWHDVDLNGGSSLMSEESMIDSQRSTGELMLLSVVNLVTKRRSRIGRVGLGWKRREGENIGQTGGD